MNQKLPLVSIMIPNYNHSMYLDQCIVSAKNQTYENIEIVILDNSSGDNSVQVAAKYIKDGIRVCRNPFNILNTSYKVLDRLTTGDYKMLLCADDFINESFVEKAVTIMEAYPNVGYVHGERDFVKDSGERIELDPFFNCSFVAPGLNVMPIYMVTTIAHPSQGIFRANTFHECGGYDMEIDHMNADRMLWYYLSYESDYGYIREKMCNIRIGNQTETFVTQTNFQHPILCHLTLREMVDFARDKKLEAVYSREQEALERLANDFLNYAVGMLVIQDNVCAGRYLDYIKLLSQDLAEQERYSYLCEMQRGDKPVDMVFLRNTMDSVLKRPRNYEPPQNYEKINLEVM